MADGFRPCSPCNYHRAMPASAGIRSRTRFRLGLPPSKLRPVLYAVLAALLPLAVAAWAVGRNSAQDASDSASTSLAAEAQQASRVSALVLDRAGRRATAVARLLPVQRALVRHEPAKLARIARHHPDTSFVVGGTVVPSGRPRAPATRTAVVTLGGKRIGTVVVGVSRRVLDASLRAGVRLDRQDVLVLTRPGVASRKPGDVRLAGHVYRAAAAPISGRIEAVVARPASVVDGAVRNVWLTVLGAALATLGTVAAIAWAAAPLIARGRMTQRERAEALRILSHVGDGVFLTDGDGTVRFWNRAAERITGLSRREVWGRPLAALPGLSRLEGKIPVGEEGAVRPQTLPVQLGGRELWLSLAGVTVPEGTVYTFADVTEEQRLEQLKTDFLSTVSHELRTPLTGLYGAAVTLRERGEALTPPARAALHDAVSEQAEHLVRIVEDVLVAYGLESDSLLLARERFDAVALAGAVVAEARARYSTARVQLGDAEAADAIADPARTRQVLENLIDNAVKYAAAGLVRVAVERGDGVVVFGVSDEGPGIPEDKWERIFERFYRSDVQLAGGVGGTGLGLYISRELVKRMGGRLWLESTPGAGSLFLFELPLSRHDSTRSE
jgi:PAS domain S-box-containing protein